MFCWFVGEVCFDGLWVRCCWLVGECCWLVGECCWLVGEVLLAFRWGVADVWVKCRRFVGEVLLAKPSLVVSHVSAWVDDVPCVSLG